MSEQNEPVEFDYTREEIRDLFGLTDTDLRNLSKREWEENSASVLDTIHLKIQANEKYTSPRANILINNREQLDDLAAFLSRLANDENMRNSFLVYPDHPYEHTTTVAANTTAELQAQNAQQLPPPPPPRPSNNEAINNNNEPIFMKGYYQFDAFKESFKESIKSDEVGLCEIKEGSYKSLDALKADTEMWNLMTPEQQARYESKGSDFYPVEIFLCKTRSTNPEETQKIEKIQQRFSDLQEKAESMDERQLQETIGEKISNTFRPGR